MVSHALRVVVVATLVACVGGAGCTEGSAGTDAPGASVRTQSVEIASDSGRVLAGTFTLAASAGDRGARGAVLLIGGSGPQDRDGTRPDVPGYAPLRDFADSLAARGMHVLRLDDRGVGGSTGAFLGATSLDFARDAQVALRWLRAQPAVSRVAVVGHSEGALVAMLVARHDSLMAGVVLLGAASRSGREIARWQRQWLVTHAPSMWPVDQRRAVLAAADSNAERTALQDPWLRVWFSMDPRLVARDVRAPVLLVHGERDRQVPSEQVHELARALGGDDVSVRLFPSTNHLLLEDRDGEPTRYAQLPSMRVRGEVVQAVTGWLVAHLREAPERR